MFLNTVRHGAVKRTPLGTDAFWDKPTPDPPLRWEKLRVQIKLALLAKEKITLDTLLGPKPEMVDLTLEQIYEELFVRSSTQSKRERNARNAHQKMNWQNKCPRLIEIGIMCGDKPWPLADRRLKDSVSTLLEPRRGRTSNSKL